MRETTAWVGRRIKEARESAGKTQGELAADLHKTQTAISQWEAGKRAPRLDDLVALARALDSSLTEFLPDIEPERSARVLMRAVLEDRLQVGELTDQLERFANAAERLPSLEAQVTVSADRPIRAAQELLSRAQGVAAKVQPPVPIEQLANLCGVNVYQRRLDDAVSGLLIELASGPVIGVNRLHADNRQRFTIAHELGHFLLRHHDRFHVDLGPSAAFGEAPFYDPQLEREANDFAANVLMPASAVRESFRRHKAVTVLAQRFNVSELAMGYRLMNLGLR